MDRIADNIQYEVQENVLYLQVDLRGDCGMSKSGKSWVIASTHGNISIPGIPELKIGMNLYKAISPEERKENIE